MKGASTKGGDQLQQLSNDLAYAAGSGAAKLASSVVARGNMEASTGLQGPQLPGPALQSVLARHRGRATEGTRADPRAVSRIADHMASDAADQAVRLLAGDRS